MERFRLFCALMTEHVVQYDIRSEGSCSFLGLGLSRSVLLNNVFHIVSKAL